MVTTEYANEYLEARLDMLRECVRQFCYKRKYVNIYQREDFLQSACLKALKLIYERESLPAMTNAEFDSYIRKSVYNMLYDKYREERKTTCLALNDATDAYLEGKAERENRGDMVFDTISDHCTVTEMQAWIQSSMEKMPKRIKIGYDVLLRQAEGYSIKEYAEAHGMKEKTVSNYAIEARHIMKHVVEAYRTISYG